MSGEVILLKGKQNKVKPHAHHSIVVIYQLRGTRKIKVGTENYLLKPNSIFLIYPNQIHSLDSVKSNCYYALVKVLSNSEQKRDEIKLFGLSNSEVGFLVLPNSIRKAQIFIIKNLDKKISISALSQHVNLSKFHFIRLFKKYFGVTPHAFQNILRIQLAKEIMNNKVSFSECAAQCGFFDQSHFDRHFKKQVGLSPQNYLKKKEQFCPMK